MARVAILSVPVGKDGIAYHAVAGDKQSQGRTLGEALDALTALMPEDEMGTLMVRILKPDAFFSAAQQERLAALMERWRAARDADETLFAAEQAELDSLVEAKLSASAVRAAALADQTRR